MEHKIILTATSSAVVPGMRFRTSTVAPLAPFTLKDEMGEGVEAMFVRPPVRAARDFCASADGTSGALRLPRTVSPENLS